MQYHLYTEDNEEAVQDSRRRLISFLNPCWAADNQTNEWTGKITEKIVGCDDDEIVNRAGDGYVERHCRSEEETSSNRTVFLRRLSYFEQNCTCIVRCDNGIEFFRFAGCRCLRDELTLPDHGCLDPDCVWKVDDNAGWNIISTTGSRAAFASIALPPGNRTASLYSPYFQQISIQCVLEFAYRLNSVSHSSLTLSTEFLVPDDHFGYEPARSVVFREEMDYYSRRPRLGRFEPGHFTSPTRLRIECRSETRSHLVSSKNTSAGCQIGKIVWDDDCTAGSSPLATCELESRFCEVSNHMRCMDNVVCDIARDCPNGKDEESCDDQPVGAKCDFNDETAFCDGWTMLTVEQAKPVTEHLLQVKRPLGNVGPIHASRPGGGGFLLYSSELNWNRSLSTRDTFFTSPFYPPIFNDDGKCKLRFYAIQSGTDAEWSLSIVHPLWVQNAEPIRIPLEYEGKRIERSWHRISADLGQLLFPFAVQIEANWVATLSGNGISYVAVDDISLSVECFDKAAQLSPVGNWTSMTIDTCGSTGTQRIRKEKCLSRGHRRGPYQFLSVDDQQQIWTVPETLLYRLIACGAEGGSFPYRVVENGGGCVIVDIKLIIGTKLHISIGQKGESPCDKHVKSSMKQHVLESLCYGQDADQRLNASMVYGAGGGGATTVSVDSAYIIVAAGGGGAYPSEYIEGIPNKPAGGLLRGKLPKNNSQSHSKAGDGISVSLPSSPLWSCGRFPNFGGIAAPCEPAAGGGGGFYGGQAQTRNHGLGGTNWIGINVSSYQMKSGVHKGDGLLTIHACRLHCPPKSTCFFTKLDMAESMECLCEHGETVSPSGSCTKSKALSLLIQRKWAVMTLLCCIAILFLGFVRLARRCTKRRPTAADQIKLLVMKSDYNDVDIGEPYWDQIASLPCLPWDEIVIGREIGTGAFGTVHEGRTLDGQVYAVKTICMNKSTSAEAQREFAFEALFMHKFNHPNVVRLHWIQWDPPRLRIILEFMGGGDLRSFLREARPTQDNFNPYDLRVSDLINIALDIARGCEELNRQKYIHRDLAARNCLLTEKGPNRRVKIGDFGMARDIYENNYYRKGGRAKLPVRWMPPEAFLDGLFTTQTDVWSFGVVLWEISSFGMLPYFGVDNFDVMGLVTNGGRLDPPNTVPTEMHDLMRSCWNTKAEDRPSFTEIATILEHLSENQEIANVPIHCFAQLPSGLVSPWENPVQAMPVPSPSIADTPCTVVTALSPGTPEAAGFGISMNGVPYIPINTEALRELREEKSMRYNPDADSDSELTGGTIVDTSATMKNTLLGNRVPPTPPPRRPTSLPRFPNV
nr:Tyrosine protein kinase domain containing protein [Haemonchus contortus]